MTLPGLLVALALAGADASVVDETGDGGRVEPRAAALTQTDFAFVGAWASPLREDAFGATAGVALRGADLWTNQWRTDGGVQEPHGVLLCPAAQGEHFSEPRVAWTGADLVYVWRVEKKNVPGHQLRVARVTGDGGISSCTTELVANTGVELTSLQLAASGASVLAMWEAPSGVFARLLGAPAPMLLAPRSANDGAFRPTLTRAGSGFQVLWLEGGALRGVEVSSSGMVSTPTAYLQGALALHVTAAGFTSASAVMVQPGVSPPGALVLTSAPVDPFGMPFLLRPSTTDAAPLAAAGGSTLFASHRATSGVAEFEVTQTGATAPTALPSGATPEAMASGPSEVGLLTTEDGGLRVSVVEATTNNGSPFVTPLGVTRRSASQQDPSAAWVEPAGWVLGWREAERGEVRGFVVKADGTVAQALGPLVSSVIPRMVTATNGGRAASTTSTPGGTTLSELASASLPGGTSTVRLSSDTPSPGAAMGVHLDALWSPKDRSLLWARGGVKAPPRTFAEGVIGRCGAFAGDRLFIATLGLPMGGALGLLALDDSAVAPTPELAEYTLVPNVGAGGASPCLAANGTALLVAFVDGAQQLKLYRVDVATAPMGATAVMLATPQASVKDPVVAAITGGWQVAWEKVGDLGTEVWGLSVTEAGVAGPATRLAELDSRNPALAAAPTGQALLSWNRFNAPFGRAQVTYRLMGSARAVFPDAGVVDAGAVEPADAGVIDAGSVDRDAGSEDGGSPDAGVEPVDGGVTPNRLVPFSSCGCSADGASALALLALAALRRRAARR